MTWFIAQNNPPFRKDVLDEKGDLVAHVVSSDDDARLIAAAPKLLEAVRQARGFQRLLGADQDEELTAVLDKALARAEGKGS